MTKPQYEYVNAHFLVLSRLAMLLCVKTFVTSNDDRTKLKTPGYTALLTALFLVLVILQFWFFSMFLLAED